jgi:hypothetical protein
LGASEKLGAGEGLVTPSKPAGAVEQPVVRGVADAATYGAESVDLFVELSVAAAIITAPARRRRQPADAAMSPWLLAGFVRTFC